MDIEAETETDTEQRQRRRRRRRQRQRQTGNQSIMAAATEAGRELRDKVAQHPGQPSPQPVGEWVRVVRRWCHWCSRHLCAGGGCKEGGREEEGRKGGRGQGEGLRAGHARVGVLKCKSAGTVACRHQAGEWSLVTGHWSLPPSPLTVVTPPLTPHPPPPHLPLFLSLRLSAGTRWRKIREWRTRELRIRLSRSSVGSSRACNVRSASSPAFSVEG